MYKEHPEFKNPQGNPKLWRFLDFTKFVNILDTNTLYFCRTDLLGDPFEGTWTAVTIERKREIWNEILQSPHYTQLREDAIKNESMLDQIWTKSNFVSCWHMNEYEPYSMWKTYTKTNEAVSIQSSWTQLIDSLSETPEEVMIGIVDYLDYSTDENKGNLFRKILTKRKNFAHETELRAVVLDKPQNKIKSDPNDSQKNIVDWEAFPNGLNIKVKLEDLIEKIIIAPKATPWFKKLVESICEKYNIQKPVEKSELDEKPRSL